jgi:hypothetical protein
MKRSECIHLITDIIHDSDLPGEWARKESQKVAESVVYFLEKRMFSPPNYWTEDSYIVQDQWEPENEA